MLNIDMLKGQGIPLKSSPGTAFLLALIIAIPVLAAMAITAEYLNGRIKLKTLKNEWSEIENNISQLSAGVKFQASDLGKINNINACFVEVHEVLQYHIQWTPVFVTLIENLPNKLFLEKLTVDTYPQLTEVPKRNDPLEFVSIDVPESVVFIDLYSHLADYNDKNVLDYIEKLNSLESFIEKIESIRLLGMVADKQAGVKRYSIKCVFKHYSVDISS
ncbi:MAG TPA: hypothetical protein ENH94_00850 [Phycisphaerales bacterium]|nr:hypothetical protein [Phycisphaerales bacterium]